MRHFHAKPEAPGTPEQANESAKKDMSITSKPGVRRFVIASPIYGVLLGIDVKKVQVRKGGPGRRALYVREYHTYWSSQYQQAPNHPPGACTFLNQYELEDYCPFMLVAPKDAKYVRFVGGWDKCWLRAYVVLPAKQAVGDYMVSVEQMKESVPHDYLLGIVSNNSAPRTASPRDSTIVGGDEISFG